MLKARADISAACRRVGRLSSALHFFARDIPERDHSISFGFSDIDIKIRWELSGTRVAIQFCYVNGVMENRWMAEGRHQMETARAMTLQRSIEVATRNWASIHNTGRCPRCSGLMVDEWGQDLSDYRAQRCVQCGDDRSGHSVQPRSTA